MLDVALLWLELALVELLLLCELLFELVEPLALVPWPLAVLAELAALDEDAVDVVVC